VRSRNVSSNLAFRPNVDGSIPKETGFATSFHMGAYVHQIVMPARRVDPRLIHPLLLHLLLDAPPAPNPVGVSGIKMDAPTIDEVINRTDLGFRVPDSFKGYFSDDTLREIRDTFSAMRSSPNFAPPADFAFATIMVKVVVRMFWIAHNVPVSNKVESSRKQAVYNFKSTNLFKFAVRQPGSASQSCKSGADRSTTGVSPRGYTSYSSRGQNISAAIQRVK
jgi:hypothetical protein